MTPERKDTLECLSDASKYNREKQAVMPSLFTSRFCISALLPVLVHEHYYMRSSTLTHRKERGSPKLFQVALAPGYLRVHPRLTEMVGCFESCCYG